MALRAISYSVFLIAIGCSTAPKSPQPRAELHAPRVAASAASFTDVTAAAGIRFKHTSGRSGRLLLPETMGSGCAFLDYDGDENLDIFLVNAMPLPGSPVRGPVTSALYRNKGDGTFEDVTRAAGLAQQQYGNGCAVGDYDNDGHPDLFVSCLGPDRLYRNRGGGTGGGPIRFEDVTKQAGTSDPHYSTSAAWFDYDRDGRLDLFVGNYCRWNLSLNKVCQGGFGDFMCPPEHYKGDPPRLYHNQGDGMFRDVTKQAGLYNTVGKNLGVLVLDFDDDGWLDLMIANDLEPNLLYRNKQDGTFQEIGVEAGVAYSNAGKARAGMGIDGADIANDGREAIVIGNNTREGLALFLADGQGGFNDVADTAGIYGPSLPFLTFGAHFVDLDNDALKDIFAVNGHVNERIEKTGEGTMHAQRPLLFRNTGGGRFAEVQPQTGSPLAKRVVARGLAVGDYDNDGDQDLLVSVCDGRPMLLRNDLRATGAPHWLAVKLVGTKSNRSGIGTRVTVEASGVRQSGWVRSGSSYCSASDLVAWFGLGDAATVDRITLRWPSGTMQTLTNVKANQRLVVTEEATAGDG